MARWARAARLLDLPAGSKVLDLGCAFGFGTGLLTGRYQAFGHDLSASYIHRARRRVPSAVFTLGPADRIPYGDGYFDGLLLLDVLEHVPDEQAVIEEVSRVLRPGGKLVLSVPNAGLFAGMDSLNLYRRILGDNAAAPTDDPSWTISPHHRHYALTRLQELLGDAFRIQQIRYSGWGLAEPVNLALLLLFRRMPRLYEVVQYLYFGVYLAEDLVPTGDRGYHLMLVAERRDSAASAAILCAPETGP
ncbi:MAG: class I SAM-dependent methyltransferase [Chloroflexota bacterium]